MVTRRFIMQKARRHCQRQLRPLVGAWFQELFHSPRGVLFTFPSQYSFTIGLMGVFSLTGWARLIRAELHVFRGTQDTTMLSRTSSTGLSPSMVILSRIFFSIDLIQCRGPTTPMAHCYVIGLGYFPFARHY